MMTKVPNSFKNKKVLIYGMSLPGGGVASANWLLDQGAHVSITDARAVKRVEEHIKKNARDGHEYEKNRARLTLLSGKVSSSAYMIIRKPSDEVSLFCAAWPRKIISIMGAQGKTTTTLWAAHLIGDAIVVGHDPDRSPMSALQSRARVALLEGSIFPDAKSVSTDTAYASSLVPDDFDRTWGEHNISNLGTALEVGRIAGLSQSDMAKRIPTLPMIPYRQEIVHDDRKLRVINDTTATSPQSAIAAFKRWGGPNCILIAGGTDKKYDYQEWAQEVPKYITANNTVFLSGTATTKMKKSLGIAGRGIRSYDSLERCWKAALKRSGHFVSAVVLFSPGAGSSELFTTEFQRGEKFNALIKNTFR